MKKAGHVYFNTGIMMIASLVLFCHKVAAQSSQEADIRKVVDQLFDGMRLGDSAMVRNVFLKENSFSTITSTTTDSVVVKSEDNAEGFIKAVGTPHADKWDERIYDLKINVDGPMSLVWAPYKFYRGETFSHCGVNVFILVKSTHGWKIKEITDTRRKTDCP